MLYAHLLGPSCSPFEMVWAEFIDLILEVKKLRTGEGKSLLQGHRVWNLGHLLLHCKATLPNSHLSKKLSDCSHTPPLGFNSCCDDFASGKTCFLIAYMHPESPKV